MIDKIKKCDNKGFSLVELLITILIVLMIGSMMTLGINFAMRSQSTAMDENNADVLLSTTMNSLRNTLAEATEVSASGQTLSYRNSYTNASATITSASDGITLTESGTAYPLVPAEAATNGLYTTYDSVTVADNIITFTNIKVVKGEKTYASIEEFNIRFN